MFTATVLLSVAALRVRTAAEWAGAGSALLVLLGLHTFGNLVREQPILVVTCCALAFALAFAATPARWRGVVAAGNLVIAMFIVEIGLLVWVIHASAYLLGRRGLSRPAVVTLSGICAGYFVLRFLVLPAGAPTLFPRDTGFGFSTLGVDELRRDFGSRPLVLYAYNVAASMSSVLFSEPRAGVFQFVARLRDGGLHPWMWTSVLSSLVTTLGLVWFLARSWRDLRGGTLGRGQALAGAACAVIVANAVISYPYSRDVTMSPAGLAYALAVGAMVAAMIERASQARLPWRAVVVALAVVTSCAWAVRTAALTFSLRNTAFVMRNDWVGAETWLQSIGHMPTDAAGLALLQTLKRQALDFEVPNPGVAQQWAEAALGAGDY
jgi:hypothetical protein